MARRASLLALLATGAACTATATPAGAEDGLLFSLSGEHGLAAEQAGGGAEPIFARGARSISDGASGSALSLDNDLILAWPAAGNIYAQRGTLSFFFRAREPYGTTPFPIFRVGAAEGSSWDMTWLRIDWNGHGFDAFVTDTNLARTRVSQRLQQPLDPARWIHIAFAWDEAEGVALWIDGKRVAAVKRKALYDQGLFGFGPFQRIVSPYQVQSAYNFRRGGDIDELRIHGRMLGDSEIAALAAGTPAPAAAPADREAGVAALWRLRHGWTGELPPPLDSPVTAIRKVEFADTRDLKQRMFRGADGIRETTWPGVYNRSRLPGRHDYFELPDWNVYSEGGKAYTLTLPDEVWNRIEIVGAAAGPLYRVEGDAPGLLLRRAAGQERSSTQLLRDRHGGTIRFDNVVQEVPIQEIAAYRVGPGTVPAGVATLSYSVDPALDPAGYPTLEPLTRFIAGRFVPEERASVVALPGGAPRIPARPAGTPGRPIVHILVPADFRSAVGGGAPSRYNYAWKNLHAGLDGIALDLPALSGAVPVPLNIRVKDPLWPEREMLDVNVSVRPGQPRTLWLDLRDRILPDDASLWLSLASASGLTSEALAGLRLRLVFKDYEQAKQEHVADRFEQARDNLAFFVEEQPGTRLYPLWDRFERDISDLLRVDPGNVTARAYWADRNPEQPYPPLPAVAVPAGTPAWAFWQSEELKLYRRFVDWWIDQRQIANGEFGGGLSDDTDLVNQWVPLALMGIEPERLIASQRRVLDATYANGMWSGGLSRIRADELHSYEEGINAVAQAMQLSWGDPTAIERAMAVAREYPRLVEVNPAGHSHMISAYFSGTDIVREGTLGWQRPYGLLILHPGLLLAAYNGAQGTRALILSLLDGWLAHADGDGRLPGEIEWASDKTRGSGIASAAHVFWAAWSWTGDARYLRPIETEIGRGNLPALTALNADLLARTPSGAALARRIAGGEAVPTGAAIDPNLGGAPDRDFARFVQWQTNGDNGIVAGLFAAEAETDRQRMHILTEGHLWSDRVSVPNELLQRARLGGVAHRRNAFYPGNLVSWRFAAPAQGEQVAILIPQGDPRRFRVIAHNLSDRPVAAEMIGAELAPGLWRMTSGIDGSGDNHADAPSPPQSVTLERGRGTTLSLPAHQTIVFDFALASPGEDPATRADIGLSADDIRLGHGRLNIRVHSLGARPTPPGVAIAEDAGGRELARARFPALAAPTDLLPRISDLSLRLPSAAARQVLRVRLELDGAPPEVTAANNAATLGDSLASEARLERR